MALQPVSDDINFIGPYQLNRTILCSADASPNAQRKSDGDAGHFFPGAKWVGAIRNASELLGCRFVILTTGHGLVNPNDIITPYDLHIEKGVDIVNQKWHKTIPGLLVSSSYEVMIFYSGGCPRDRYVQLLKPILHSLGISLFTYGKPNMFDIGKTIEIIQLLVQGATFLEIASLLKCPERAEFYQAPSKVRTQRVAPHSSIEPRQEEIGMEYSIEEHKHRFAAWAAGRAASINGCRFPVEEGKTILEKAGMKELICSPNSLPTPQDIDGAHREWRLRIIEAAAKFPFTHGIAAKLINIYLKAAFVCGGHHDHERVRAIHPPIDSLLLDELSRRNIDGRKNVWDEARKIRWSNFSSDQYERVIRNIREAMKGAALWEVEKYWRGYQ